MFAKQYFDTPDKKYRMAMIGQIKENESSIFDDMKEIVKQYIKNNINTESISV